MPLFAQTADSAVSVDAEASLLPDEAGLSLSPDLSPDETTLLLDDPASGEVPIRSSSSFWALLRAILVLAVLAVLVWLLLVFIRRRASSGASSSMHLKVLAQTSLGLNRQAHVLCLGKRAWIVASTESAVNLIAEVDDQELIDQLLLEDSKKSSLEANAPVSFLRMFASLSGKNAQTRPAAGRLRKMRERLKDI